MSSPASKLLAPDAADGRTRLPGPATLRGVCLAVLIALVVQYGLGMVLNLYVPVPSSDAHAGFVREVETAPLGLTLHALLGTLLILTALAAIIGAVGAGDRVLTGLAVTGLGAILGAFASGELFVRDGKDNVSLSMALLTGIALVCYISALARTGAGHGRLARKPPPPGGAPEAEADGDGLRGC